MTLPSLRPDPSSSTHDSVYRQLRAQIMYGNIPPGHALTIRGIADSFGVSMTPAREAVRRLNAEGALTMSSSGRVSTPELSNDRVEELAALRSLLEVELASRALPRAHAALVSRLQSINSEIDKHTAHGDGSAYIKSNWNFTARFICGPKPRRCWP